MGKSFAEEAELAGPDVEVEPSQDREEEEQDLLELPERSGDQDEKTETKDDKKSDKKDDKDKTAPTTAEKTDAPEKQRHDALVKQLNAAASKNPSKARIIATTLAKEFPTLYTAQWLLDVNAQLDKQERVNALIKQLNTAFASAPTKAKAAAAELSQLAPTSFSPAWLAKVNRQIDAAVRQRAEIQRLNVLVNHAKSVWDRRPEDAKSTIQEALQLRPGDRRFRKWAADFIKQVDTFQDGLLLERTFTTRPTDAVAIARRMHSREPRKYTQGWLSKIETGVWKFQDAAWAARVSREELAAWVGANAVEWDEVPDDVKQELGIRLGQMKRDQLLAPGGGGVKSTANLAGPSSETQRYGVLDQTDNKSSFEFSTPDQIPAKRMEKTAQVQFQEAQNLRNEVAATTPTDGSSSSLIQQRPDVMTAITNQAMLKQAADLQRSGSSYVELARRLRNGDTTVEAERNLMRNDVKALQFQRTTIAEALTAAQTGGDTTQMQKLDGQLTEVNRMITGLETTLATPDGVLPNAGGIAKALDWAPVAMTAPSKETAEVNQITKGIEYITGTQDPYSQGIGRNVNEQLTGLVRLTGRFVAVEAGITKFIANCASYVLPESFTTSLREVGESQRRQADALKNANTGVTSDEQFSRNMRGDSLPLIDRAFNNTAIMEKPDQALAAAAGAVPVSKPVSVVIQGGLMTMQAVEAFFATYAQTESLTTSLKAVGWSVMQGTIGLALGRFGAAGDAGMVAVVYAMGKARGLSSAQIEEEIAWTLVGIGVAHATRATTTPGGVAAIASEVMTKVEGSERPIRDATQTTEINRVSGQVENAMLAERTVVDELLVAQKAGKPTKALLDQLREVSVATQVARKALQDAYQRGGLTEAAKTETPKTATLEPDGVKSDATKTDAATKTAKTEPVKTETVKPETVKPEAVKPETVKPDAEKTDAKKTDEATSVAPSTDKLPPTAPIDAATTKPVDAPTTTPSKDDAAGLLEIYKRTTSPADGITPQQTEAWLVKRVQKLRAENPELTASMSDSDLMAIAAYTSNDGMDVNRALREPDITPGVKADAKVYQDALDPALAKLPAYEGNVVRVATYDPATLAKFEPGLVFTDPGYLSTSAAVTDKFQGNTFIELEQTSGRRIDQLSSKKGEAEVLMPRGSTFEVVSVSRTVAADGTPIVKLKLREVSAAEARAGGKDVQTIVPPPPQRLSGIKITTPPSEFGVKPPTPTGSTPIVPATN